MLGDTDVDDLVQLYNDEMTSLLDKHCPVVNVQRRAKQLTPWFDADCRAVRPVRRKVRAAERRFRRTRSDADKLVWSEEVQKMRAFYENKNSKY